MMLNEYSIRVALESEAAKIQAGQWGSALATLHFERILEPVAEQLVSLREETRIGTIEEDLSRRKILLTFIE
jgi:hypothetical protein